MRYVHTHSYKSLHIMKRNRPTNKPISDRPDINPNTRPPPNVYGPQPPPQAHYGGYPPQQQQQQQQQPQQQYPPVASGAASPPPQGYAY
ncbi:hypothetical protein BJX62DRAFT_193593, partial [Aspergillus germanicus]